MSLTVYDSQGRAKKSVRGPDVPMDKVHYVGQAGEPTFQGTFGTGSELLRFRKDPFGRVWVRGTLSGGAVNTTIFTLPTGYRPITTLYFDCLRAGGASGGYVYIDTAGNVLANVLDAYIDITFDIETVLAMPGGPMGPIATPLVVTALPTVPYDGQEIYYRFVPTQTPASTIPIIWHLKWDAATSAWLPVGDQRPILAFYSAGQSISMGSGSWGTYDANDPRVTAPLAGIYEVECGVSECYGGGTAFNIGIGQQGTVSAQLESGCMLAAGGGGHQELKTVLTTALNDLFRQYYWLTAAGAQNIVMRNRYMQIRPLRITP